MQHTAPRSREAGVTLIEVIVALGLMSLIAVAGFSMLSSILRVQDGTEGRLERLAEIDRALLLFSRDVQSRSQDPLAWDGRDLTFVRGAIPVRYHRAGDSLMRSLPSGLSQEILPRVESFEVRALDDRGRWHETWPIEAERPIGLPPMLVGLELRLDLPGGDVSRLIDLPREVDP
ncbi:MAG: prepilin-type N-terminal cleavage/methylation domain-containing protein [Pseudomonadota bacterium]